MKARDHLETRVSDAPGATRGFLPDHRPDGEPEDPPHGPCFRLYQENRDPDLLHHRDPAVVEVLSPGVAATLLPRDPCE